MNALKVMRLVAWRKWGGGVYFRLTVYLLKKTFLLKKKTFPRAELIDGLYQYYLNE